MDNNIDLLKIIVATTPSKEINLKKEINLVKAGILYGDKVHLHNFKSDIFEKIFSITKVPISERIDKMLEVLPIFSGAKGIEESIQILINYKETINKKSLTNAQYILKLKYEKELEKMWPDIEKKMFSLFSGTDLEEINSAVNKELVVIENYDSKEDTEELIMLFLKNLISSISESNSYPLFDFQTTDLVKSAIQEKKYIIPENNITRGNEMSLINRLFERLPTFEHASVDEIIDVRTELRKPLIRFRGGIKKISGDVKNAFWDKDFNSDVHELIKREIEPSILEIEELINENTYLKNLFKRAVDSPLLAGIPTLGIIVSNISQLPSLIIPAMIPAVQLGIKSYLDFQNKQKEIEQNYLFFYYKLSEKLN